MRIRGDQASETTQDLDDGPAYGVLRGGQDAARVVSYCDNCDRLVGLEGYHVIGVARGPDGLVVRVESPSGPAGCPDCGVRATSRGRREHRLVDIPAFGTPVRLVCVKRTWACREPSCPRRSFTEVDEDLAPTRSTWTTRARSWAVSQLRREHATVHGLARQFGIGWDTVWSGVEPILAAAAADESRFAGVKTLGVVEHVWHLVSTKAPQDGGRGPQELTGMVDLTCGENSQVRAHLLDLVAGPVQEGIRRLAHAARRGLHRRRAGRHARPVPGGTYPRIDEELEATAVLDAFHVVALATRCVDEVRRRVQQATTGYRGRKGDPLYGIQTILRAGVENLTDKQLARIERAFTAHEAHEKVDLAWQCAQRLRSAYKTTDMAEGRQIAERIVATFPTCPIPEIARLGRTLRKWKEAFLAYFTTGATNGGTEAINGLIELHRRLARSFKQPITTTG